MKRVITLFAVLLMGWSVNAWSFACKTANGTAIPIGGGSANVYVNLAPAHYRLCHTATRLGLWRRVI